MNRTRAWLAKENLRLQRVPRLEDALLGYAPSRYVIYRLRYVFLRALLRTGLRVAELALFATALPPELLGVVIIARNVLSMGEAFWWGSLETLRADVRHWHSQRLRGSALRQVRRWLGFASLVSVAGVIVCLLWITVAPSNYRSFSVVDAYLLACAVRWVADVMATTYHAGVYGIRRVFRPLWSLALVDVAEVSFLALGYWVLGVWGVALALAAAGVLRAALTWAFTRNVYSNLDYRVGSPASWLRAALKNRAGDHPARLATDTTDGHSAHARSKNSPWRFGWGNLLGQADAWIVLALLSSPGSSTGAFVLAALFHVLTPLLGVATTWIRLFYFDFKRLQAWGSPFLLERFEALLSRTAVWIPLPIAAVVVALMAAFWRGPHGVLSLELIALSAVRARSALVHMRAYALGDHRFLLRFSAIVVAVTAVALFTPKHSAELALAWVVLATTLGLLFVGKSRQRLDAPFTSTITAPSVWLQRLLSIERPVRLGVARVDRRLTAVGRLHSRLQAALPLAEFSRIGPDTLVWLEVVESSTTPTLSLCAGAVKELHVGEVVPDGKAALRRGLPEARWTKVFRHSPVLTPNGDPLETLRAELHAKLPAASLVPLSSFAGPERSPSGEPIVTSRDLRTLVLDAARGHSGFRTRTPNAMEVSVFSPGGYPTALVVVPTLMVRNTSLRSEISALVQNLEVETVLRAAGLLHP